MLKQLLAAFTRTLVVPAAVEAPVDGAPVTTIPLPLLPALAPAPTVTCTPVDVRVALPVALRAHPCCAVNAFNQLPWAPDAVAFVLDNVLTAAECAALVVATEHGGYRRALVNTGLGEQTYLPDVRLARFRRRKTTVHARAPPPPFHPCSAFPLATVRRATTTGAWWTRPSTPPRCLPA